MSPSDSAHQWIMQKVGDDLYQLRETRPKVMALKPGKDAIEAVRKGWPNEGADFVVVNVVQQVYVDKQYEFNYGG